MYRWSGSAWAGLGSPINGPASDYAEFGYSVAASEDGEIVVVGTPSENVVQVFRWTDGNWDPLGLNIAHAAFTGDFGHSVAMSADGATVAVSEPGSRVVRVFRWSGSSWGQVGSSIAGGLGAGSTQMSVALSADGDAVVLGNAYADTSGSDNGIVRVLDFDGSDWVERGSTLEGNDRDYLGWAVDISDDGRVVAHSVPDRCRYEFVGEVSVREWDGTRWSQRDDFIPAPTDGSAFALSIALSGSGDTLVASDLNAGANRDGATSVWRYGVRTAAAASTGPIAVDEAAPAVSTPVVAPITELPSTGVDGQWWAALVLMLLGGVLVVSGSRHRRVQ